MLNFNLLEIDFMNFFFEKNGTCRIIEKIIFIIFLIDYLSIFQINLLEIISFNHNLI